MSNLLIPHNFSPLTPRNTTTNVTRNNSVPRCRNSSTLSSTTPLTQRLPLFKCFGLVFLSKKQETEGEEIRNFASLFVVAQWDVFWFFVSYFCNFEVEIGYLVTLFL